MPKSLGKERSAAAIRAELRGVGDFDKDPVREKG